MLQRGLKRFPFSKIRCIIKIMGEVGKKFGINSAEFSFSASAHYNLTIKKK